MRTENSRCLSKALTDKRFIFPKRSRRNSGLASELATWLINLWRSRQRKRIVMEYGGEREIADRQVEVSLPMEQRPCAQCGSALEHVYTFAKMFSERDISVLYELGGEEILRAKAESVTLHCTGDGCTYSYSVKLKSK